MPKDLFQDAGINPSQQPRDLFADAGISPQPKNEKGFLGSIADELKNPNLIQHINNLGGAVAENLAKPFVGLANLPADLGLTDKRVNNIEAPFVDRNSDIYQLTGAAAQAPGYLMGGQAVAGAKALSQLPALARALLGAGGAGFGMTEGDIGQRTLAGGLGAGGTAAIEAAPVIGNTLKNALGSVTGKLPAQEAGNFYKSLLGRAEYGDIPQQIANDVRGNYTERLKQSSKNYQDFLSEAAKRGYKEDVGGYVAGLTEGKRPPGLHATPNKLNIDELKELVPGDLKSLLKKFQGSPSIKNAHDLQSALRSEASGILRGQNLSNIDKDAASRMLKARDVIRKDITGELEQAGHKDLADKYLQASQFHREQVAPYLEDSAIYRMVTGKEKAPAALINALKRDSLPMQSVREHLSPETNNLVLAQALKNATSLNKKGVDIDPKKLIGRYQQLEREGFGDFIDPNHNALMDALQESLNKSELRQRYAKLIGSGALGAALMKYGSPAFQHFTQ